METKRGAGLTKRIRELEEQLVEARDTIEAIRTGQVDALILTDNNVHTLYTLHSADHAYRVFIEKMAEGAVSLNDAGIVIYSNSMFATMVGYPLTRVIGFPFITFVADEHKEAFCEIFSLGWKDDVKREVFLVCGNEKVPVQLSVNSLSREPGAAQNIIVTDLSRQKMAEKALKEKNLQLKMLNEALAKSNSDLQQFASVASHDLQEPLRKIQVFSQFLKDRNSEELTEGAQRSLEKIISSSNRMKTLIVDILAYSRLSADDNTVELVSLRNLCDEIIDDLDLKISEKNARVELGDLPTLEANKGQLRQVFNNLISNALKFTKADVPPHIIIESKKACASELGISIDDEERFCCISVKDNGIGFDDKYSLSIFNLFEKLNAKSSFEGSGIGLAIAKKIIDKHGGVIAAKSRPGEGSEFNIILPLKRTPPNGS